MEYLILGMDNSLGVCPASAGVPDCSCYQSVYTCNCNGSNICSCNGGNICSCNATKQTCTALCKTLGVCVGTGGSGGYSTLMSTP